MGNEIGSLDDEILGLRAALICRMERAKGSVLSPSKALTLAGMYRDEDLFQSGAQKRLISSLVEWVFNFRRKQNP